MLEHSQLAVSAPSGAPQQWHDIDWWRVQRNVRAMQIRIAKACREGNWRRVKALQRMLTRSRSARYLAVRRVTENQGKRTAGVDRVLWDTPDAKWKAANGLKRHGYKPRPLRRVFIPKSNGKERPLGIPTMTDRAMQALYLLALAPIAETTGDPNSYGFRIERSTADAMGQLFVCLSKKVSAQWVLEADIKGCFDHINHDWLITNVPTDKVILRKWLKAGVIHKCQLQATDAGTPQGGIVSPSLANLVLDGLESQLKQHLGVTKAKKLKINVVRYADDFVITGTSREVLETEVRPWVEQFLAVRGLQLSLEKTRVVHIKEGFDFLGWNFRKYDGKLLIKPSKKNVKAFYSKVREVISTSKTVRQEDLIRQLNPILRGWAFYHQPVVAKKAYSRMDYMIFLALWRWAKRRHPKKTLQWIGAKYFKPMKGRKRVFATATMNDKGEMRTIELYSLASTPIERHKKVSGEYNPFDPSMEEMGEKRRMEQMLKRLAYRKQILSLFQSQKGLCPMCKLPITKETGWHDHHILYRTKGGGDSLNNRVLLHPLCHQRLHARGLTVNKPAPLTGGFD
ncbi:MULTISPECIES: group II intron reverse transcriptase/maturase [Pseudomonas]|uniref:Group II intron reverse transcriptase/maturase n=3 Tax=Pseudomonas TaxID=286 RepID=A0ABS9FYG7_9PSED|nr:MULTISPECIES: group II intron reverse transcriptase/maturase [Pseudomonas]MCF4976342.1 group II intron reverse transcriptase/maturase [Pseudomonas lactis]MCF5004453.1 group II intron reverse transcriptase/maturase [Pseudomonas lactis]MCF5006256.1 group II intron reverse transcriptase/maturase [Pseudomonas lactis]MCF5015763.1 group II intron reverse transcriptase/maturase [Pseudomonas lactis]MCF5019648.1 group II intron reverse transcriptase/maturase [Pseudomonas lactis]